MFPIWLWRKSVIRMNINGLNRYICYIEVQWVVRFFFFFFFDWHRRLLDSIVAKGIEYNLKSLRVNNNLLVSIKLLSTWFDNKTVDRNFTVYFSRKIYLFSFLLLLKKLPERPKNVSKYQSFLPRWLSSTRKCVYKKKKLNVSLRS